MTGDAPWLVERRRGPAGELHQLALPEPLERRVWLLEPTRPALVLGSTQRHLVGALAVPDGVEVVVRRSGGGAVLLEPGRCTWVDLLLPRRDPWWVDDVSRSARWLGWTWVAALAAVGVTGAVHQGRLEGGDLAGLACFAGVAPGEVVAGTGAAPAPKLVGISQRRTRAGARFQCVVHHGHDPGRLVALLGGAVPPEQRTALHGALAARVGTVAEPGPELVEAFLAALRAGA